MKLTRVMKNLQGKNLMKIRKQHIEVLKNIAKFFNKYIIFDNIFVKKMMVNKFVFINSKRTASSAINFNKQH